MRSAFGWDLPPGVANADIERSAGAEDPVAPRCEKCGRFLPLTPDRRESWEDALDCDGTVTTYEAAYTPETVAILGDEFAGKPYPVAIAACGRDGAHPAHHEVMWAGENVYRRCACGHENKEVTT